MPYWIHIELQLGPKLDGLQLNPKEADAIQKSLPVCIPDVFIWTQIKKSRFQGGAVAQYRANRQPMAQKTGTFQTSQMVAYHATGLCTLSPSSAPMHEIDASQAKTQANKHSRANKTQGLHPTELLQAITQDHSEPGNFDGTNERRPNFRGGGAKGEQGNE